MHSADCYLNITYLFYLGRAWFSLRSGPPLKACACPLTISAPWLLRRSWGKNAEKVMLFSVSWRRRVWKWGFKWSANRRERATVSDRSALGSCYGRDPVSPPSQEQHLKHPWDPVATMCSWTVSQCVQGWSKAWISLLLISVASGMRAEESGKMGNTDFNKRHFCVVCRTGSTNELVNGLDAVSLISFELSHLHI